MTYSFVGIVKRNSQSMRVLVVSEEGRYYVWTTSSTDGSLYLREGMSIPSEELELANQRQINIGRGEVWTPNSSKVREEMIYIGVVSGGKARKTILVKHKEDSSNPYYFIYAVPSDFLTGLYPGDHLLVDTRKMSVARPDHIDAGLGNGKLKRKRRVSVS